MTRASKYHLKSEDVRKIINATKNNRDKLIIELLAYTGCRRLELVLLRFMDIDFNREIIMMPTVKKEKQRIEDEHEKTKTERIQIAYNHAREIPIINPDLLRDLKSHFETMKDAKPNDRLIWSRQSKSITEPMINYIVRDASIKAGVISSNPDRKYVHPHLFRHSFVRFALKKGLNFKNIQNIVGHESVATTMDMYGHPSIEDVREDMKKMGDYGV
ncbi:tyrosine-type recombinase/integrase [Thermoplasmatota archaeon]